VVKYRFVDGNNKITSKHDPKYVLELMVTFRGNVPINYGYYCVLKHGWALAPFSCVALSQTTMLFRIQKCSFTQALWSSLGDGAQEGSWLRDHLPISFYGPFVSTDCTSGVYRNMAVLVTGTGDAVSNAIVKMQEQRTYWDKVTVIKCGKGRHVPASSHLKEGPNMTDESDFLSHIAQKGQKEGQLFCSLANFNKEALLRMLVVLQTHHFEVVICSGLIAHQIKILKHEKARFKNVTVNWHAVHIESFAV
jgi:hypothetical protein